MTGRLLVIGDSLTYHGPSGPELVTDPRLWPQRVARPPGAGVDLLARQGWTARDAWWALTKDPVAWSVLLPRADVLVLAVGGMDSLPASVPTYLREGIAFVRPAPLRRVVRRTYRRWHPGVVRLGRGRLRALPQRATDHYLSRVVAGARHYRPGLPRGRAHSAPVAVRAVPGARAGTRAALAAARAWAVREHVRLVDVEPVVERMWDDGGGNPDGLHWDWPTHAAVAQAVTAALEAPALT